MNYNHTVTIIPVRNHMEKIIFMLNEQQKHEIESLMCSRLNSSRVTRSSLTTFNEKLCLFCQEKGNKEVHEIMQDSKDTILKQAFKECPVTLETFKIRSEKALDTRAGDLKYHATCWNKYINRRVPDFPSEENLELLEAMPDSFNDTLDIEEEPSTSTASTISKTSRACVMADRRHRTSISTRQDFNSERCCSCMRQELTKWEEAMNELIPQNGNG